MSQLRTEPISNEDNTVGITLITGFLGSGKSTLIRRVLTEDHGLRIVVVENEYGETAAIEQAIVTQGVGPDALEEFIELPNGCICCQAQDDLVDSLTRLVDQKRGKFDHILVEASGLADPRPVAASFWVDAVADASLRLDAVVAVVDASSVVQSFNDDDKQQKQQDDNVLARMQVAVADIVLLNKMDIVSHDLEEELIQTIRKAGSVAKVMPAVRCNVDIRSLLNLRMYNSDSAVDNLPIGDAPQKFHHHIHDDATQGSIRNDQEAVTFTLKFQDVVFDSALLNRVLGHMLWDQPETISIAGDQCNNKIQQVWRMKALVIIHEEDYKWIYQSVHTLFDDMESSVLSDDGTSLFLFIGQDLDRDDINNNLKRAILDEPSS